jgi:hydantoinase/carbamoylase family amidase
MTEPHLAHPTQPNPPPPLTRPDRLRARLERLAEVGKDPPDPTAIGPYRGVSRFPYTDAHAQAVRLVAGWMREAGLKAGCDQFGNLVGIRSGTTRAPAIVLGSHLDSVPHGGMFDGALGVLAAVEVAQTVHERGISLRHPLTVVGFADEEGFAFGRGTLASRCLVGDIPRVQFAAIRGRDGRTLAEALATFHPGLPAASVPACLGAYLELHVEQGPVLAQSGRRVAVVTGITGMARMTAVLEGEANHAGTTPMALRRDALVSAAAVVLAVRALAEAAGPPVVGTVGALTVSPGATNIVPGRVEFSVEFRSPDDGQLTGLCRRLQHEMERIAQDARLEAHLTPWDHKPPAPMDAAVQQTIAAAIRDLGHEPFAMPSGAGHDAMILAPHVPAGMIFVPSVGGISHSPREWTEWADAALGADVLLHTVLRLDAEGGLSPHYLPGRSP